MLALVDRQIIRFHEMLQMVSPCLKIQTMPANDVVSIAGVGEVIRTGQVSIRSLK
jgi:hypothetical protein